MIIPIGVHFTDAVFKREINKESEPFPFDWMISTPSFVFEMLTLLLEKNIDIRTLVIEHFFRFDKKLRYIGVNENYMTIDKNDIDPNYIIYNEKYDALFPNVEYNEITINKYIESFDKLKNIILNSHPKEELKLIYTSEYSSLVMIDGRNIVTSETDYLLKINNLISKYKNNYKLVIFDTNDDDRTKLKNSNIIIIKIKTENHWSFLIEEMVQYAYLFHFELYKYLS